MDVALELEHALRMYWEQMRVCRHRLISLQLLHLGGEVGVDLAGAICPSVSSFPYGPLRE